MVGISRRRFPMVESQILAKTEEEAMIDTTAKLAFSQVVVKLLSI